MTKKAKLEQFDRLQTDKWNLDCILHDLMNDRVTWGAWVKDSDSHTRVGISDRAMPLAIVMFRYPGQSDAVQEVCLLERFEESLRERRSRSQVWDATCRALISAKEKTQAKTEAA